MQRIKVTAISLGFVVVASTVAALWLMDRGPDLGRDNGPDPGRAGGTGATAPNIVRPGAPGASSSTLAPSELGRPETVAPTRADVDFVEGMIHHHHQALVMADYVVSRGSSADLKVLARRLRIGQDSEITQMRQWLEDNRGAVPDGPSSAHTGDHGGSAHLMPGMLTAAELARLAASSGREFDRLFLQYMIRHHQGALTMIEQLYAAGGGSQSELDYLIRHIDTDQTVEITRMRRLLQTLR
jgi:uncharacterized protein (DUF305 family)